VTALWRSRNSAADSLQDRLRAAGAAGVITHGFSGYPGIDKVFGSPRLRVLTLDITCEDYGLLARMAERRQSPRIRVNAATESRGERPVFNTIAEIRGRELPDEYVVLSAHFDSWSASGGATDNGTGTVAMMEAMRILKTVFPSPKRTILVGHWSGEEQGLNGSRAFVEDHPQVVSGLQALFNQDNGTGRITFMSPGALPGTAAFLQRYLGEIPREITQYIRFSSPGMPATGGSDHASFACAGAPAFGLGSLSWDYGLTTWHTNRDTYDKIVLDDLRNNAILIASLAYQASEDPARMPRDRLDPLPPNPQTGEARTWPECRKALRSSEGYAR
jgi:Zn-dependent M28 family amino/carboxypeptidase